MSAPRGAGEVDKTRHRGGRHLDSSRDPVLREAALGLLAEVGYDRLTMDAVAARARAGKTTIYRRWPGKAELVVDAMNSLKGVPEIPDSGSLRRVFGEKFIAPRMAGFRTVFERAVARGEMPGGHDLDLLARLFPALALQQLIMSGELPGVRFARQIMDEIVYPLATAPAAPTSPAPHATAGGKPHG